jgi:hypothetical protein
MSIFKGKRGLRNFGFSEVCLGTVCDNDSENLKQIYQPRACGIFMNNSDLSRTLFS